jgi:hypothetical protein
MKTEDITPLLPSGVLMVPTLPLCIWASQSRTASQAFNIGHPAFLVAAMQQQCKEEDRCAQMQVKPNASIDGEILCICTEYDTCAAPLNAILDEINRDSVEFRLWKDWCDKMAQYQLVGLKCWDTLFLGVVDL